MSVLFCLRFPREFISCPYTLKLVGRAGIVERGSQTENWHERFETSRTKLSIYTPILIKKSAI